MTANLIPAGKINGAFGIKGWVKIFSHTSPRENIFNYKTLYLKRKDESLVVKILEGKIQGKKLIVRLSDVVNVDDAEALIGYDVYIDAKAMPKLAEGDYYWSDLIGMDVVSKEGTLFGSVHQMIETGANDVMEVTPKSDSVDQETRLIPFVFDHVVLSIRPELSQITVDWQLDY